MVTGGGSIGVFFIRPFGQVPFPSLRPCNNKNRSDCCGTCCTRQVYSQTTYLSTWLGVGIKPYDDVVFDRYTASIVMNAVYDYDPVSRKDPMVDIVEKVVNAILDALRPDVSILIGAVPASTSIRRDTSTVPCGQVCCQFSLFRHGCLGCRSRGPPLRRGYGPRIVWRCRSITRCKKWYERW